MSRSSARTVTLRAVAAFEAAKGLIVVAAGCGLLLLVHRDVQSAAERLVAHLHLDPASRLPRIFLELATQVTPVRLKVIAAGAFAYAGMRLVEAVGLWRGRRWAAWFGVATGLVYVPFEAWTLVHEPGWEPALALAVNVAVVVVLAAQLGRQPVPRR
jgi:uncharacterized membrane protein (DUF2068 family)